MSERINHGAEVQVKVERLSDDKMPVKSIPFRL